MGTLSMHNQGDKIVTRSDLDLISMPVQTDSYIPVSHFQLANYILTMGQDLLRDFTFESENYGLANEGQQMFGVINFKNGNTEIRLSVGFRNSYNKSMSVGICIGATVFVCSNMMFSGDITIMRKHTKNVWQELEDRTISTLYKANHRYDEILDNTNQFKEMKISNDFGFQQLGVLFGHDVIGPRQMTVAKNEWVHPSHEEFQPRNAWSLYNCVTQALKSSPPIAIMEDHIKVHTHFKELIIA